jgi:hypothetical protein
MKQQKTQASKQSPLVDRGMKKDDVIKSFWANCHKHNRGVSRQKNKRDALGQYTSDVRNAFASYVDDLHANCLISYELAITITL